MNRNTITVLSFLVTAAISGSGSAQDHPAADGEVLAAGTLLTNDSIVRLTHAGISQETIVRMVHTQAGRYAMRAEEVIALKDAGVSDVVLDAMLDHSALGCGPAMTVPMELFLSAPTAGNEPGQPPGQPVPAPHSGPATIPGGQAGVDPAVRPSQPPLVYHYGAGQKKAAQNAQH